jgi:hypothetical protein
MVKTLKSKGTFSDGRPRKNKPGAGRPDGFHEGYIETALNLCLLGLTDEQLAKHFNTSVPTLSSWKKKYPKFLSALKEGRHEADGKVARSLYQRALGSSHPDVHISNYMGQITITPIIKNYAPDTTACIFWLKNRNKVNWRDKIDITDDNSPAPTPVRVVIEVADARKK